MTIGTLRASEKRASGRWEKVENMAARLEEGGLEAIGWKEDDARLAVNEFRKFGHRASLLYPFVKGTVLYPGGQGKLMMLLEGMAYILPYNPKQFIPTKNKEKKEPAMISVDVKKVRPVS